MSEDAPTATAEQITPGHVAIIMDGNGRWARQRGRPRSFGHGRGVEAVRKTVEAAGDFGVKCLTLFSFSTENWNRPKAEIGALFELMKRYVQADLDSLHARGVRIRIIGRREELDRDILEIIEKAEQKTQNNTSFSLNIAFNYGGRDEIVRAAQALAHRVESGTISAREIDHDAMAAVLDTAELPDVDLLIRTSGEQRISNFLLWQAAYAELVFMDVLWPDFSPDYLRQALDEFARRERRYGGVDAGAA